MEQTLNEENIYTINIENATNAPEVIFELSSALDNDEVKNKRICLKLGNIDLNQAQLLSIKSLINGIDSNLSSIETKSVETEKVALALGIVVSNVSPENVKDLTPVNPYKTAEDLKEEIITEKKEVEEEKQIENNYDSEITKEVLSYNSLNESESTEKLQETCENESFTDEQNNQENQEQNNETENIEQKEENQIEAIEAASNIQNDQEYTNSNTTQEHLSENENQTEQSFNEENIKEGIETDSSNNKQTNNENVQDELEVIFGSNPKKSSIFSMEIPKEIYEEKEEIANITIPEQEYTKDDIELETFPTKYIKQTIRSGQVINYEGNLVIIGDCHPGCEVIAFGDITVWGVLSGIAHAGAGGNEKARVRALKMNAIQLRIANCYSRRPDSLNSVFIEKTNSFTPEEARIINGEIVVFKIND